MTNSRDEANEDKPAHTTVLKQVLRDGYEVQVAVRLTGEDAERYVQDLEIIGVKVWHPLHTCAGKEAHPDALW